MNEISTDLARVTIEDLSTDNLGITSLVIPAYTRSWESFQAELQDIVIEYYNGAANEDASPSIGDFAFYLLMKASKEPKSQSDNG